MAIGATLGLLTSKAVITIEEKELILDGIALALPREAREHGMPLLSVIETASLRLMNPDVPL